MSEQESLQPLSVSQREVLEEATATYEASISPLVARLLVARGIDRDTAVTFRLGVVSDPFPGHDRFRGWISIPYLDKDGAPLTIRFRCPESMPSHPNYDTHHCRDLSHGKYMTLPDDPARVFNVRAIHQADDELHVTEGEFDTAILTRVGLHAVAIPGAQGWRSYHRRMMAGFNRVWVWGDPDDAGADFNRKVTQSLRQARSVRLREGDVTDTYMAGGAEALLSLIEKGKSQ